MGGVGPPSKPEEGGVYLSAGEEGVGKEGVSALAVLAPLTFLVQARSSGAVQQHFEHLIHSEYSALRPVAHLYANPLPANSLAKSAAAQKDTQSVLVWEHPKGPPEAPIDPSGPEGFQRPSKYLAHSGYLPSGPAC